MAITDRKGVRAGVFAPALFLLKSGDWLGALGLFAMMAVTFVDVLGRTFFNQPLLGATELTEILVAATVCFVFPSLSYHGLHATIDVLDPLLPRWIKPLQHVMANLIGAVAYAVVAWRVWIEAGKTARFGGMTPLLEIPMAPVLMMISVLAGITTLAFVLAIILPGDSDQ